VGPNARKIDAYKLYYLRFNRARNW